MVSKNKGTCRKLPGIFISNIKKPFFLICPLNLQCFGKIEERQVKATTNLWMSHHCKRAGEEYSIHPPSYAPELCFATSLQCFGITYCVLGANIRERLLCGVHCFSAPLFDRYTPPAFSAICNLGCSEALPKNLSMQITIRKLR